MAAFLRGGIYWYKFVFNGDLVRRSTKQRNKRVAEQMEAAHRTALAKGAVGLVEAVKSPSLTSYAPRFIQQIRAECVAKPATVRFYEDKLAVLLGDTTLAASRLDRIDEAVIDRYKQMRLHTVSRTKRPISVGTVNRELATLRRLLRMAHDHRLISRVPRIRLLRGEKERTFVLDARTEIIYLAALKRPLLDVAQLLLDTGLRVGEVVSLDWAEVRLTPAFGAKFGRITVLRINSKNSRSRVVPLTPRASEVLRSLGPKESGLVFHRRDGRPLGITHLDQQHRAVRDRLGMSSEFVLHSLRHTFGTRLGEAGADAFTIMRLMGHSTVTISQRYVHPSPEFVEKAVERLQLLNTSKQEALQSPQCMN